jgi:hypothetical protein
MQMLFGTVQQQRQQQHQQQQLDLQLYRTNREILAVPRCW